MWKISDKWLKGIAVGLWSIVVILVVILVVVDERGDVFLIFGGILGTIAILVFGGKFTHKKLQDHQKFKLSEGISFKDYLAKESENGRSINYYRSQNIAKLSKEELYDWYKLETGKKAIFRFNISIPYKNWYTSKNITLNNNDINKKFETELLIAKNLQSQKPEEILKNINQLHLEAKDLIQKNALEQGASLLKVEILQYNHTITLLTFLKLESPLILTVKKRDSILELYYKTQSKIYIQDFNRLSGEIAHLQNTEQYSIIEKKLIGLNTNLENRIKLAKDNFRNQDLATLSQYKMNITQQFVYNQKFVQFKLLEQKFNSIIILINDGELKQGLAELQSLEKQINEFLKHQKKFRQSDEKYKIMYNEIHNLKNKLPHIKTKITDQYSHLVMGDSQQKLTLPTFSSNLTMPQIIIEEKTENIGQMINALDELFAQWDQTVQHKAGKT